MTDFKLCRAGGLIRGKEIKEGEESGEEYGRGQTLKESERWEKKEELKGKEVWERRGVGKERVM
jgi:hypothetical protein